MEPAGAQGSGPGGWLEWRYGPLAGQRVRISHTPFLLGRATDSNIHFPDEFARLVSKQHLQIVFRDEGYVLEDLNSTNGTFHNGSQVQQATLAHGDQIDLGPAGPSFVFLDSIEREDTPTLIAQASEILNEIQEMGAEQNDPLLSEAVLKVRAARRNLPEGVESGQTMFIMRDLIDKTIYRKTRKFHFLFVSLLLVLAAVCLALFIQSSRLVTKKLTLDQKIQELEVQIRRVSDPEKIQKYLLTLANLQKQAVDIERNLLYELGSRDEATDFVEVELHRILSEFGAETYSIPPEFLAAIKDQIDRFISREKRSLQKHLLDAELIDGLKAIFEEQHLPPDLVYLAYVESRFKPNSRSRKGAVGLWQLRYNLAKAYGLTVTRANDERRDPEKSTLAAAKYLKKLILDFGAGSSSLLALAGYNYGPTKLRDAIRKIPDPIQQRNFWYLYRSRLLPKETREYVPKVLAVIIIARNPERFGLTEQTS